jgi:hypothetical protein
MTVHDDLCATPKFRGTLDDWHEMYDHINGLPWSEPIAVTTAELDALRSPERTARRRGTLSIYDARVVEVADWDDMP